MTGKIKLFALAGCVLLANIATSWASNIELQVMQGDVLVNDGSKVAHFTGTRQLAVGSLLVMREKSVALLTYVDHQCFVRLVPNSMMRITETPPCEAKSFAASSKTALILPANGVYEVIPPSLVVGETSSFAPVLIGSAFFASVLATAAWSTLNEEVETPLSQ